MRGIGREIAEYLVGRGSRVYMVPGCMLADLVPVWAMYHA